MRRVVFALTIAAVAVVFLPALPLGAVSAPPEVVDETMEGLPADRSLRSADVEQGEVSAAVETPIPFTMVGFTVPEGAELEFRTSPDGDEWAEWRNVDVLAEDGGGPEMSGTEDDGTWHDKTDPEWVGEARWVQTRGAAPGEIEVHLIDSDGLSEGLGEQVSRAARGAVAAVTTSKSAQASGRPSIVSRAQWGANESWRRSPRYASNVRYAVVHHTAGSNNYSRAQAPAVVRGIYSYHTRTLGWADVGYNFLVDRYGTVYEGRAGGVDRGVIGAHSAGFNSGSTGISIMGNFQAVAPPQVAQQAVADVLSWKFDVHGIVPDQQITVRSGGSPKYAAGREVRIPTIIGHRDVGLTACPGNVYYQRMGWLRAEVRDALYERQSDVHGACSSPSGLPRIDHASADALSWAAGKWYFSGVDEVVVASSADYADALAGSVLAAERGAPMMLTEPGQLSERIRAFLREENVTRVWLLGGPNAVSPGVASALEGAHGSGGPSVRVDRVAGADRFETAAEVAAQVGSSNGEVAIALGRHADFDRAWPDALGAASLAATPDRVPTLLTRDSRVPDPTLDALDALGVDRVRVLGGPEAVAEKVVTDLRERGFNVDRLAGSDRYATSAAVAEEAMGRFPSSQPKVTFASGRSFRDALIAGPVAARRGGPLVLVPPDDLGRSTELLAHLRSAGTPYTDGVVVGSTSAVNGSVSLQLCQELR